MVRRLTYIILLVGSESEFYISNIIGIVQVYMAGSKVKLFYENN